MVDANQVVPFDRMLEEVWGKTQPVSLVALPSRRLRLGDRGIVAGVSERVEQEADLDGSFVGIAEGGSDGR